MSATEVRKCYSDAMKSWRQRNSFTQSEAASTCGISIASWSKCERGYCSPNLVTATKIYIGTGIGLDLIVEKV